MNYNQNRTILGGNTNTNANVTASLSNMNISNLNITTVSNATIDYLTLASVVANSVAATIQTLTIQNASMQTFNVQTPNQGVIILQESNTPGLSSLSSIVSFGLSTVYSPYGISSLSSIVSYGLSTVYSPYGISSLSSIVSYGLSTVTFVGSNTFGRMFLPSSIGGTDINQTSQPDSIADAFSKIDSLFELLISKPPKPKVSDITLSIAELGGAEIPPVIIGPDGFLITLSNPYTFYFCGQNIPTILYAEMSLSYSNQPNLSEEHSYSNMELFNARTQLRTNNPGMDNYIDSGITCTIFIFNMFYDGIKDNNNLRTSTSSSYFLYNYELYGYTDEKPLSSNNPYIFTFEWKNNGTHPPGSNNIFKALINFGEGTSPGNYTLIS